jgi:(2S)-methylsuccinyl-CoA dehydrogenase
MSTLLEQSGSVLELADEVLQRIGHHLARSCTEDGKLSSDLLDQHQIEAYDYAWMCSESAAAHQIVAYAHQNQGAVEKALASLFLAEFINHISEKVANRFEAFGLDMECLKKTLWSDEVMGLVSEAVKSEHYQSASQLIKEKGGGTHGLSEDHQMFRETFKKFGEDHVMPLAEKVHREDLLIPDEIIQGLAELGCFGLSIPQKYGGFQDDENPDNTAMVVVTEELSRASLGIAGSLITRPEILSKALLKGGTEEQKQKWLPLLASGEKMCAVAVTEPDYGSDVANMKVSAKQTEGGWLINGVKTWCTFAGRADTLMVLARTDPDMSKRHKGFSILIAEKPKFEGHGFSYDQERGGHIEGKAIPTIGYRGMHSYEVAFEDYFVPDENLIGGQEGLGKGFYYQMEGFAGGRLQTAARALGVMQASFENALQYSDERKVFGKPLFDYGINQWKLVRMAMIIQASRQLTYHVARLMDAEKGQMEATLIKFYASRISEWVTREALQIHGGYGYAEEYPVSRYFVDARVFSIFEGAEEVLALKVIVPTLLKQYL